MPLARHTRLKRKAPMRAKRTPVNRPEWRVDEKYKAFVRSLQCRLWHTGDCQGRIDPDHMGADKGTGLRAPDDSCAAMCRRHHDERQQWRGYFGGWTKARMRSWCEAQIAVTRALYEFEMGSDS